METCIVVTKSMIQQLIKSFLTQKKIYINFEFFIYLRFQCENETNIKKCISNQSVRQRVIRFARHNK